MRLPKFSAIFALACSIAVPMHAASEQAAKSFEVASVKQLLEPSERVSTGGGPGTTDPGRWWRSNVTLASILVQAFHVQGHTLVGPDWLTSTRYAIEARVPPGATREDVRMMVQTLLAERFGLKFHRERRVMPVWALVVAKGGPKLKASAASPASIPGRGGFPELPEGVAPGVMKIDSAGFVHRVAAGAMPMSWLADYLAGQSDLPVVDLTELPGTYDIVLYYTRQPAGSTHSPVVASENDLDLRSALREQLGLELRAQKAPLDVLVIDHIEQTPLPN